LLLAPFVVVLAAGCGSEPTSLKGSDEALRDASTSRIEQRMEGKGLPEWAFWNSAGLIDYANGRGELVYKGKNDSAWEARAVLVGRDSYLGAKVGDRMYWMNPSVDEATGADRFMPGAPGMSPDRLLKDLIKSSKEVEELGSDEIRGVTATHYRAHLDKAKLGIEEDAGEPDVVDVWIDEQGLPRRIRVPAGGEDLVVVFDLFDFGVPVDIDAPPANEVVSENKFGKLMEKECADAGKDPEDANPLCLIFAEAGTSSGPTETIPRRVSDY
jgi:hypothetical protein